MLLFLLSSCSFYEFKNHSGSEVRVTYEKVPEPVQNVNTPVKASEPPQSSKSPVHPEQKSADTSSLDQCIAALVSKVKGHRDGVPARIAVHRFNVIDTRQGSSDSIEERISAAVERSILKNTGVQLITRRRLNDLQLEQKLNQAAWNTEGNQEGRIGIKSAEFIIRGSYTVAGKPAQNLIEIEILDTQTGRVMDSKKCVGNSF